MKNKFQFNQEVKLGNKLVGKDHKPYVIAEMSGNHNQSLEKAMEIIDAAAKAGADALKIQTYTPDTMTLDISEGEFFISDSKSLWKGKSLYELYKEAMTPWEWHKQIQDRCHKNGMSFFSTPFDATAVDFLEELNVPFYKIASFENTDIPLIKKVAKTKKPVIVSTGMATLEELTLTVQTLQESGCRDIILLKCTSAYPAPYEEANLKSIQEIQNLFGCLVGLSDHTMGTEVPIAAVTLGAVVIEKHFCLGRSLGGVDSAFSMEPQEFSDLVRESENAWKSIGKVHFGPAKSEEKSLVFRRSVYAALDIKEGDAFTEKNIRCIRPGLGLAPKYYEGLIGKKAKRNLKRGQPLKLEDL